MPEPSYINAWERAFFAGTPRPSASSVKRAPMQVCDPDTCSRLSVRRQGRLTFVALHRPELLADDESARALGQRLVRLVTLERVFLLLNLRGVHYASSTMIGGLAGVQVRARISESVFRIYNLEPLLSDALRICRLDRFLCLHATEAEAIAACEHP